MNLRDLTDSSILVVAHPDDEILWFSSIVRNVDRIVFCFSEVNGNSALSEGRKRVLHDFPHKQLSTLNIKESDVFNMADWKRPQLSEYGLEFHSDKLASNQKTIYMQNFSELCERLRQVLKGYRNVITHNPWGEYGHEEHVQIYRAVKNVQAQLGFDLWVSNYYSTRSFRLMDSYGSESHADYITVPIDKEFAVGVRDLYQRHGCWTWYTDYEWLNEESFIRDDGLKYSATSRGHSFPLNMIRVDSSANPEARPRRRFRLLRRVARLFRFPQPKRTT